MYRIIGKQNTIETVSLKELMLLSDVSAEPAKLKEWAEHLPKPAQLGGKDTPDSLNDLTMGKLMQLQSITNEQEVLFVPCEVLLDLSKRDVEHLPGMAVLGFVQWVAKEVERINKLFASTNVPPTQEEKQAGADSLNFGPFGLIDYYAQRMGITDHGEVDKVPWVRVFKCLDMDAKKVRFEMRLRNVIAKKHERRTIR